MKHRVLATLSLCVCALALGSVISAAAPVPAFALPPSSSSSFPTVDAPAPLRGSAGAGRLLDEVLQASGVDDPARREGYRVVFEKKLEEVGRRVSRKGSAYHRARRLHDELHEKLLLRYAPTADGIDAILDRLIHNSYRLALKGESMRKQKGASAAASKTKAR